MCIKSSTYILFCCRAVVCLGKINNVIICSQVSFYMTPVQTSIDKTLVYFFTRLIMQFV